MSDTLLVVTIVVQEITKQDILAALPFKKQKVDKDDFVEIIMELEDRFEIDIPDERVNIKMTPLEVADTIDNLLDEEHGISTI